MIIPRDAMTAEIRRRLAGHDEWDSLHTFEVAHWRDGKPDCHMLAVLDRAIPPPQYPQVIADLTAKALDGLDGDLPDLFLLQVEGFGVVKPREDAGDEEKMQFGRDMMNRHFHRRPDAVETFSVMAADVCGRLWTGTKARENPAGLDVTDVGFSRPGNYRSGGRLPQALLAAAASVRKLTGYLN